jgi:antibiotic biosynthesis monooxygenase (ABM) superfamily enzyme
VVRRRIKAVDVIHYEELMQEYMRFVLQQPGHLGITVLRPSDGSRVYTVVNRFVDQQARRSFTDSPRYKEWQARFREISEGDPDIEELGGLAAWFTIPNRPSRRPPPKHKMAAVTLLGVYPLSMLFARTVPPILAGWPAWLVSLVIATLIVTSLTWLVMPNLTRVFEKWLFPKQD